MAYVYCLIDPRTGDPFYVGSTINPPKRWQEHIRGDCETTRSAVLAIKDAGEIPITQILTTGTPINGVVQQEFSAIRLLKSRGYAFVNVREHYKKIPQNHGKPWDRKTTTVAINLPDLGSIVSALGLIESRTGGSGYCALSSRRSASSASRTCSSRLCRGQDVSIARWSCRT